MNYKHFKHFRNPSVSKMLIVQMNGYAFFFSADIQHTDNIHSTLYVQNSVSMRKSGQLPIKIGFRINEIKVICGDFIKDLYNVLMLSVHILDNNLHTLNRMYFYSFISVRELIISSVSCICSSFDNL